MPASMGCLQLVPTGLVFSRLSQEHGTLLPSSSRLCPGFNLAIELENLETNHSSVGF